MKIHIDVNDLEPKVRSLYTEGSIKSFCVDYQPNSIMGWVGRDEIEVFNFSKVCRLDNRWTSYELILNQDEIVLEITNLNNKENV